MAERYAVSVGAGTLCIDDGHAMAHRWTGSGVTVQTEFTGAHLLHLAVAGGVLEDVYREAEKLDYAVEGVHVSAQGGFEEGRSTGIEYSVAVASRLTPEQVARLLDRVEEVAGVPQALGAGVSVRRVGQ